MAVPRPFPDRLVELIAERLQALAQPLRIRILDCLALHGEMPVHALADALGATQQNTSRHLNLLYASGMVVRRQEGRVVWYGLADDAVLGLLNDVAVQILERLREPQV